MQFYPKVVPNQHIATADKITELTIKTVLKMNDIE